LAAEYPPFMFGYGVIEKIIAKIQDTSTPEQFTHEYLAHKLGFARESDRAFIPMAKRIGLLSMDGKPTELYQRVRDPVQCFAAMAAAMKHGYPMFYAKHADAHALERKALAAIVAEITGLAPGHATARAIVGSFIALTALTAPKVVEQVERRVAPERRKPR